MGLERFWRERDEKAKGRDENGAPAFSGASVSHRLTWDDPAGEEERGDASFLRTRLQAWRARLHLPLGPAPLMGDAVAWLACGLWAGAAAWFSLSAPPGASLGLILTAIGLLGCVWSLVKKTSPLFWLPFAFMAGLGLMALRAQEKATVMLPANVGRVTLTGQVERLRRIAPRRVRLVVRVDALPAVRAAFRPRRVRLTLSLPRADEGGHGGAGTTGKAAPALPLPGDVIRATVNLRRPPAPAEPGAYDPAMPLYFAGIGATGFLLRRDLETLRTDCAGCTASLRLRRTLEIMRRAVARRVRSAMTDSDAAALALALITGDRGHLPRARLEHLRAAGLAHILAISGLHLALVAGFAFWIVRLLLAAVPRVALHHPTHKIAAFAALLAAAGYLLLSGNSIATRRAFIMLAIMTLAALLDRPAITMRNLGVAAIVILAMTPERAVTPGFQMSFLAVAGLIAAHESWRTMRTRAGDAAIDRAPAARLMRALRSLALALAGLVVTTLIASAMTALPAAWHFNRLAVWGLLGNLIALPVISLVVMPAGMLALPLMPLGLHGPVLKIMEGGLRIVVAWSDRVAGLPGAWREVPVLSMVAVILMAAGLLWLCLRRDALRLAGLPLLLAGLLWPAPPRPFLLVDDQGRVAAFLPAGGGWSRASGRVATPGRAGDFPLSIWLRRDGDAATPKQARRRPGWTCAPKGACRLNAPPRERVPAVLFLPRALEPRSARKSSAAIRRRRPKKPSERKPSVAEATEAWREACGRAGLVMAAFPLRGACAGARRRIDRFDLWRNGAHAVYLRDGEFIIRTVADARRRFPWGAPPLPRSRVRLANTKNGP